MPVALIGAGVAAAGSVAGALINKSATNKASNAATQAANNNNALQAQIYDLNVERSRPYVNAGTTATRVIDNLLYGDPTAELQASPGFQFRMQQGSNALNASFAARGLGNSGAAARKAIEYGQNFGSNEYQNRLNQLLTQQNVGLSASNALSGVATNYANAITANNNSAASAIGNGALAGAANTNALFGNMAGIVGQTVGSLSSYGGGQGWGGARNPYGVLSSNGGIY